MENAKQSLVTGSSGHLDMDWEGWEGGITIGGNYDETFWSKCYAYCLHCVDGFSCTPIPKVKKLNPISMYSLVSINYTLIQLFGKLQ